ncbi:hypothetical protein AWN76_015640 [Rhodothermaceae bacterium RA]|nr:hypothetical protein AWN76_015640 [Rhodothermaceae bacterium RA]
MPGYITCQQRHAFAAVGRRRVMDFLAPDRFFRRHVRDLPPVPAYFFHQPDPSAFERLCRLIQRQRLNSVTFSQLLDAASALDRSILLSFDDGWSSTWSIAFPLARRYGIRFTLFVSPQLLDASEACRSTIEDEPDVEVLIRRDRSARCLLTWGELRAMHASGLVDVQSHSLHHGVVFASSELCGTAGPNGPFPLDGFVPLVDREEGADRVVRQLRPGRPVYPWAPALAAPRRFIDDPGLPGKGQWEGNEERRARVCEDLLRSRQLIEEEVPGTRVHVLALPWAVMHPDVPSLAAETGYRLLVLGYPFEAPTVPLPIPVYPRLFGEGAWIRAQGLPVGAIAWWRDRRRNLARRATGAIP